jgi:hypothetical protein
MRVASWRRNGALFVWASLSAAVSGSATGAQIWERAGPFHVCIEGRFETWIAAQAELVVNEDPRAGNTDDAAVAKWTAETLEACRAQTGAGDRQAEAHFVKHMSRWRERIDELVQKIHARVRPD